MYVPSSLDNANVSPSHAMVIADQIYIFVYF